MVTAETTICNKLGLHARAASKLATLAGRFDSHLRVACDGREVDAKSIMSLMLLAAARGTDLVVTADGPDERDAISALVALIDNRFEEEE